VCSTPRFRILIESCRADYPLVEPSGAIHPPRFAAVLAEQTCYLELRFLVRAGLRSRRQWRLRAFASHGKRSLAAKSAIVPFGFAPGPAVPLTPTHPARSIRQSGWHRFPEAAVGRGRETGRHLPA